MRFSPETDPHYWDHPKSFPLAERRKLPEISCVYVVISIIDTTNTCRVLYVGEAGNLKRRWWDHGRQEEIEQFSNVRILIWEEVPEGKAARRKIEKETIKLLDPILQSNGYIERKRMRELGPLLQGQLSI